MFDLSVSVCLCLSLFLSLSLSNISRLYLTVRVPTSPKALIFAYKLTNIIDHISFMCCCTRKYPRQSIKKNILESSFLVSNPQESTLISNKQPNRGQRTEKKIQDKIAYNKSSRTKNSKFQTGASPDCRSNSTSGCICMYVCMHTYVCIYVCLYLTAGRTRPAGTVQLFLCSLVDLVLHIYVLLSVFNFAFINAYINFKKFRCPNDSCFFLKNIFF